jgi:hypothetical protein
MTFQWHIVSEPDVRAGTPGGAAADAELEVEGATAGFVGAVRPARSAGRR